MAEKGSKIGNKIKVIFKDHFIQRGIAFQEVIDLLGKVKDHGNCHDQCNRKEESAQELPDDITVDDQQSRPFYNLAESFFIICFFHGPKTPSVIFFRASSTSHI